MEMKKINDGSTVIDIGGFSDVSKKEKVLDSEKIILSKKSNLLYMLFAFQRISEDYGIDYETIILLNYLYELDTFRIKIDVFKRTINLLDYVNMGLIQKTYNIKGKNYYHLTDRSKKIIRDFYKLLRNTSKNLLENRVYDVDSETKMKSVLGKLLK